VRGDVETVRKHLQALDKNPGAKDVYIALTKSATVYLPAGNRRELKKILAAN
jgi:hypothetical protein